MSVDMSTAAPVYRCVCTGLLVLLHSPRGIRKEKANNERERVGIHLEEEGEARRIKNGFMSKKLVFANDCKGLGRGMT